MMRPAVFALLLAIGFFVYYEWIGRLIVRLLPLSGVVVIFNLLIVPAAFGVLIYLCFRRANWWGLWAVVAPFLVPLPTVLYQGGDPAKPGLHWLIYWVIVIAIALSTAIAWAVDKYVLQGHEPNDRPA